MSSIGKSSWVSPAVNLQYEDLSLPTTLILADRSGKFNAIPGPGEFGHDSWENEAWKTGGGGAWITGSFDPALGLIYWGVRKPGPGFAGDPRPGDNLFSSSVVALHADTGKLAWHFQFTPHDEHDWDSTQTPILADIAINGALRKAICWPNRNGFDDVLDRTSGASSQERRSSRKTGRAGSIQEVVQF